MHVVPSHESMPWQHSAAPGWDMLRTKELLSPEPRSAKEVVLDIVEIPTGARTPRHAYAQAEIDYVVSGQARVRASGDPVEIGPGACAYFPPGTPHALETVGDDPVQYLRAFACARIAFPVRLVGPEDTVARREPMTTAERDVAWRPVEASKGFRVRVKRLLDAEVEVMAGIGELDPGVHYTRHYHDQPELYVILSGAGVLLGRDADVHLGPGSVAWLSSREVHGLDSLGDAPLRLFWLLSCEVAGHRINWTPVEAIYDEARPRLAAR